MTRMPRVVLATLLAVLAAPMVEATLGNNLVHAADEADLAVGTELVATADVALHKAEISKGSRVSVTRLIRSGGHLDGVDVALADGHVVKVTLGTVRSYFEVAPQ